MQEGDFMLKSSIKSNQTNTQINSTNNQYHEKNTFTTITIRYCCHVC